MKKIFILMLAFCFILTGCKNNGNDITKRFVNKVNHSSGYKLQGDLSISNNDEVYNYKVYALYKKDNYYKVKLTNNTNGFTQVILKNDSGVYVVTPSLNKSFKFESEWPYSNSQIYLLDSLVKDIKRDKDIKIYKNDNKYIVKTKVKYPNNNKLIKQKIRFKKNGDLENIIVYDKNGIEKMSMNFTNIKFSPSISKKQFSLNSIINNSKEKDLNSDTKKDLKTSLIDDVIYPLFLPNGTKLIDESHISKGTGERVIMTYDGDKSFLLVEETLDVFNDFTVIPSSGEPFQLLDTLGVMTSNSLSWTSDNRDYYLISDVMSKDEMIEIAQSIVGIASMK